MSAEGALETLLERVPPEVAETFTPAQRAALYNAIKPVSWRRHPINIRLSFPVFGQRYFVTVVGGVERRSDVRLHRERRIFPLRTTGNILFLLGIGSTFTLASVLCLLLLSKLIEF
jgi:hypothetical protein